MKKHIKTLLALLVAAMMALLPMQAAFADTTFPDELNPDEWEENTDYTSIKQVPDSTNSISYYKITVTRPTKIYITIVCKDQDQKPGGPFPMPYSLNYAAFVTQDETDFTEAKEGKTSGIGNAIVLDENKRTPTNKGDIEIHNPTKDDILDITQAEIDAAGGTYTLYVKMAASKYPNVSLQALGQRLVATMTVFTMKGSEPCKHEWELTGKISPDKCGDDEVYFYDCTKCDEKKTVEKPTDHLFGEPETDENGNTVEVCTKCGETVILAEAETPAEDPTEEDPAEDPTEEDPAEDPTEEDPAEEPTEEDPAEDPTEEDPAEDPTEEDPAEDPSEEDPAENPTEEDPAENPTEEDPTEEEPMAIPHYGSVAEVPDANDADAPEEITVTMPNGEEVTFKKVWNEETGAFEYFTFDNIPLSSFTADAPETDVPEESPTTGDMNNAMPIAAGVIALAGLAAVLTVKRKEQE